MGMGLSHMERSCINHVEYSRILISIAKLVGNTRIGVSVYESAVKSAHTLYVRDSEGRKIVGSDLVSSQFLLYNKYIYGI